MFVCVLYYNMLILFLGEILRITRVANKVNNYVRFGKLLKNVEMPLEISVVTTGNVFMCGATWHTIVN